MKEELDQNGDTYLGYMSPFFRLVDDLGGDDEDEPLVAAVELGDADDRPVAGLDVEGALDQVGVAGDGLSDALLALGRLLPRDLPQPDFGLNDRRLGVAGAVRPEADFELGLRAQDDLRTLSIDDPDERRVEGGIAFVREEL